MGSCAPQTAPSHFSDAPRNYAGVGPVLAETAPTPEQLATDEGIAALSGFMIRGYADRVRVKSKGNTSCRIQLQFDH
jgi:hypothetical protein